MAVLADPESPLPPYQRVCNLASGNHEALTYTADEIRARAKEAIDSSNRLDVVD